MLNPLYNPNHTHSILNPKKILCHHFSFLRAENGWILRNSHIILNSVANSNGALKTKAFVCFVDGFTLYQRSFLIGMVGIYAISRWERIRNTPCTGLGETHTDTGQIHTGPEGLKPTAFAIWDTWSNCWTCSINENTWLYSAIHTYVPLTGWIVTLMEKKAFCLYCFLLFISSYLPPVCLSASQPHTYAHTLGLFRSHPGGVWGSGSMWKPSHRAHCQPPSGCICVFVCRCVLTYLFTCQWPGEVQGNVCGGAFLAPKACGLFLPKHSCRPWHCCHIYNSNVLLYLGPMQSFIFGKLVVIRYGNRMIAGTYVLLLVYLLFCFNDHCATHLWC